MLKCLYTSKLGRYLMLRIKYQVFNENVLTYYQTNSLSILKEWRSNKIRFAEEKRFNTGFHENTNLL